MSAIKILYTKEKIDYTLIMSSIVWLIFTLFGYNHFHLAGFQSNQTSWLIRLILIIVELALLYNLIWNLFGRVSWKAHNGILTVNHQLLIITKKKIFPIAQIRSIMITSIKSDKYWDLGGYRIYDSKNAVIIYHYEKEVTLFFNINESYQNSLNRLIGL